MIHKFLRKGFSKGIWNILIFLFYKYSLFSFEECFFKIVLRRDTPVIPLFQRWDILFERKCNGIIAINVKYLTRFIILKVFHSSI